MCERDCALQRSCFTLFRVVQAGSTEGTKMKKIALMVAGALALGAGLAAAPAQAGGFGFSVGFGGPVYAPYYRPYPAFYRPYPVVRQVVIVTDRPIIIGHAWSIAGLFTTGRPITGPGPISSAASFIGPRSTDPGRTSRGGSSIGPLSIGLGHTLHVGSFTGAASMATAASHTGAASTVMGRS